MRLPMCGASEWRAPMRHFARQTQPSRLFAMKSAGTDNTEMADSASDSASGIEQSLPDDWSLPMQAWPAESFSWRRSLVTGAVLGAVAGCVSLVLNIIGSVAWPALSGVEQHPLRIIQVYLTFPLGERALGLNSGWLLAGGCILYLATGAAYGAIFESVAEFFFPRAGVRGRLVVFSSLALVVWFVNFYGVLSWLQPLVLNGRWIIDLIPWWVAAATHLAFGWTMAVIHPWAESQVERT